MSCLASFDAPKAKPSYFPLDRRYRYRTSCRDEAKIRALPDRRLGTRATLKGILQALGDDCVARKDSGVLSLAEIDAIMLGEGECSVSTRYRWRKALIESGVLARQGRHFQIIFYDDANRTYDQWLTHDAERKARRNNKQNLRRRAARLAAGGEAEIGQIRPKRASEMPYNASLSQTAGGDCLHLSINAAHPSIPGSCTTRREHLAGMNRLRKKIEAAKQALAPPSLSPEGVAPPGPAPSPPLTFPRQVPPQSSDTPQGKCLPEQSTPIRSPLRARSLPMRVAPQSKTGNSKTGGALGSADAYPNPKAGKAKAGESKPTPRNEAEQWVHDIMARQNIPWVQSAEQGVVAE